MDRGDVTSDTEFTAPVADSSVDSSVEGAVEGAVSTPAGPAPHGRDGG
jgi:hypothetical protein